jgi:hypothetical protein
VVNYHIIPDDDGDGVDEIVVVNTASVAPNNDVIADPVPQVLLGSAESGSSARKSIVNTLTNGISGSTGTTVRIKVGGFNPASINGNIAIWTSSVDSQSFEIPGVVLSDPVDSSQQIFVTVIPPLPPGAATLTLHNLSTGSSTAPIIVTIEVPSPLSKSATQIIDEYLAETIHYFQDVPTSSPDEIAAKNKAINGFIQTRTNLAQLVNAGLTPEQEQGLNRVALMIQNSDVFSVQPSHIRVDITSSGYSPDEKNEDVLETLMAIAGVMMLVPALQPIAIPLLVASTAAYIILKLCKLANCGQCTPTPPPPPTPSPCPPSSTNSGNGTTGMGAVPPPGGNGCGNSSPPPPSPGPSASNIQAAGFFAQQPGRVVVKVLSSGFPIPFSGLTDAGGYFFIPLIPAGEPFSAVAIDRVTGQTRTATGVGPAIGASVFMFFDFLTEEGPEPASIHWDGGGNGTSWHDPLNWDLNRLPTLTDTVSIDVPGAITVTHSSGSTAILSLHSEEAIVLSAGTLSIDAASTISNTFTFSGGTLAGVGSLTVDGLLTWSAGTMNNLGGTTANGGLIISGSLTKFLNGSTLRNADNATWTGTGNIQGSQGAIFDNLAGGLFEVQNNANLTGGSPASSFNNAGIFRKSAGAGTTIIQAAFNGGQVEVLTGTLDLAGTGTTSSGGNFTVASGAVLDLTGGTSRVYVGNYTGVATGTIRAEGGTLQIGAAGATFNFGGGGWQWISGAISGPGTLTNTSTLAISGTLLKQLNAGRLNNAGTILWTGAGGISLVNGSVLDNLPSGLFEAQNDRSITDSGSPASSFNNAGVFRKSVGSGTTTFGITFTNTSTVTVQSGTLNFTGGYNQTTGETSLSGGTLAGGALNIQGGSLSGVGTVTGAVTNGGQINPGGSGAAGLLTLTGSYNQTATGVLNTELGGIGAGQFDEFNISGSATLTGALNVSEINGFTPSSGQNFQVMNYGSRSGTFATITGPYNPTYNPTNLTIQRQ